MNTSIRALIISHLCIGFICLIGLLGYPFMGAHFALQSELLLIESVMGKLETLKRIDPIKAHHLEKRRDQFATYFQMLPNGVQNELQELYASKKSALNVPVLKKMAFLREIPLLELMWVIASVAIPIFLLLGIKRAAQLVWLLPLLTIGYAFNNQVRGLDPLSSDKVLFPREETLEAAPSLKEAWGMYLIKHWSQDGTLENGEFNFNLARIQHLPHSLSSSFWERKSPLLLFLFLFWNLHFAWRCQIKYH